MAFAAATTATLSVAPVSSALRARMASAFKARHHGDGHGGSAIFFQRHRVLLKLRQPVHKQLRPLQQLSRSGSSTHSRDKLGRCFQLNGKGFERLFVQHVILRIVCNIHTRVQLVTALLDCSLLQPVAAFLAASCCPPVHRG